MAGSSPKPLQPRPLKATKRAKKPACKHHWLYDHTIYSLSGNVERGGYAVHRQCSGCGIHEIDKTPAPRWTRSVKGYELPNLN